MRIAVIALAAIGSIATVLYSGESFAQSPSTLYVQAEPSADSAKPAVTATKTKKARRSQARKSSIRVSGHIAEYYDNNIFNYSDSDRTLFKAGTDTTERFAKISKLSDNITDLGARVTLESGGRKSAMWRLRLKGDATLYGSNSFRNYSFWGVEIRRNIRRSYVELSFAWLPNYNLRNLYWRPMVGRPIGVKNAAADFKRLTYGVEIGSALSRRLDGRINIGVGSTNYKYPFDERDNTTITESGRLTYDLSKRVTVYGGFGLAQSRAGGRDSLNAIVKDISYNATLAEFGTRIKCDRRGRVIAAGSFDYQNQKYTSQKPLDTGHNGRIDHDYDFGLSLSWRVTNRLQPELNYEYRTSSSNVVAGATEFGSFSGYRLGAQLTAYF